MIKEALKQSSIIAYLRQERCPTFVGTSVLEGDDVVSALHCQEGHDATTSRINNQDLFIILNHNLNKEQLIARNLQRNIIKLKKPKKDKHVR